MADTEVIAEKLGLDDAGKETLAAPDKTKAINGLSVDDTKCKSGDNMNCKEKTVENGKDINCKSPQPQVNGDINDNPKSPEDINCESNDVSSISTKTDNLTSTITSEKNGDIAVVSDINSSGIKKNSGTEFLDSDKPIIANSLPEEALKLDKSEFNDIKPIESSEKSLQLGGDELDIKDEKIETDLPVRLKEDICNNENNSTDIGNSETSKPKSESSNDSVINSDKINSDKGDLKGDISSELVSDCDTNNDKCDSIKGEDEISVLDKDKSDKSPDKSPSKRAKKSDSISKADLPKRITRSSSGISKAVKYTDGTELSIEDDDEIKITKEVKKKGDEVKKKDEESDIEMIEECDPLAISDADVKKAKESVVKEPKKDSSVIIIDTNTLLKQQGSITAAAHTTSKTVKTQSVSASAQTTSAGATPLNPATQIQNAIQAITGGNPAIQGLQSAYLSAIQQVLIAQGGGQVSNPHYLAQLQQYYNTLGALQDDAYVIEAPSFIVPYVMEGKPIESIKEFLEKINKEMSESEKKKLAEEKRVKKAEQIKDETDKKLDDDKSANENIVEDKSKSKEVEKLKLDKLEKETNKDDMETSTSEKDKTCTVDKDDATFTAEKLDKSKKDETMNEEKEVSSNSVEKEVNSDEKAIDSKEEDCSNTKNNKKNEIQDEENTSTKDLSEKKGAAKDLEEDKLTTKVKEKENKNDEEMEVDQEEKAVKKTDNEKSEKDTKKSDSSKDDDNKENTNNLELKENKKDEEVIDLDKEDVPAVKKEDFKHLGRWEGYYKSALGKFFLELGLNHAQEFIQSDLLKMQKRKLEKMKTNPSKQDILGVKILEGQLGSTKRKNEHLHIPLKTCKFCSFKTESQLVMERHLESPHMVNYTYKCNFCEFETRGPQVILFHTEAEHNVRGRLERAPAFFQCPICPYEDNNKSKMTRHSFSCIKKFKPDKNLDLSDWEPPAKIPKIQRGRPNSFNKTFESLKMPNILPKNLSGLGLNLQSALSGGLISSGSPSHVNSLVGRGRGRPVGSYKTISQTLGGRTSNATMMYQNRTAAGLLQQIPGVTSAQQLSIANQVLQSVAQGANRVPRILPASSNSSIIPGLAASSSITIQSVQNKTGSSKSPQQPSISITPLPRGGTQPSTAKSNSTNAARPAFVICEICDGYIKDLEQLRNHMNLIHKVKIHPKMIYNRPPLNCQKCQHRFFTDQGLERHLLGTHGLVTSSMQEAANKGKDAGRCPICGKVFQWKLLNHVSRDHKMTLKPAHLSYKCTVCTATFNMYRLFENHVYSAHSVVNKNKNNETSINSNSSTVKKPVDVPLKINDEITIIPQPASKNPKGDGKASPKKSDSPTVSKEITITKVGSRSRRRSGGGVEVISLDDSPQKRQLEENPKKKGRETSTSKRARTAT